MEGGGEGQSASKESKGILLLTKPWCVCVCCTEDGRSFKFNYLDF